MAKQVILKDENNVEIYPESSTLVTRSATFTDILTVATSMDKYSGNWAIGQWMLPKLQECQLMQVKGNWKLFHTLNQMVFNQADQVAFYIEVEIACGTDMLSAELLHGMH